MMVRIPDEFNKLEIRCLIEDLGLIAVRCFKTSYAWPLSKHKRYIPFLFYVCEANSDFSSESYNGSNSDRCCSLW